MEKATSGGVLLGLEHLEHISSTDLRKRSKDVVGKAVYQKEATIITHYRKEAAAIVPLEMVAAELKKVATPAVNARRKTRTSKRGA